MQVASEATGEKKLLLDLLRFLSNKNNKTENK